MEVLWADYLIQRKPTCSLTYLHAFDAPTFPARCIAQMGYQIANHRITSPALDLPAE